MDHDYKSKLTSFYSSQRRMPTYSEMLKLFGFKSKNAVARLVEKMVDAGIVAKDNLGRLIPTGIFDEIPFIGSVKAGLPSAVEEISESVNLESLLVPHKDRTYLFAVDGDSMIDAHIADGDMVLVERAVTAKDGEIVIAEIDGEHTMKYLRKEGSRVWLEPANKKLRPMHPRQSLFVRGIVKAVIRHY